LSQSIEKIPPFPAQPPCFAAFREILLQRNKTGLTFIVRCTYSAYRGSAHFLMRNRLNARSHTMTASTPTLEDFQKFSKDQLEAFTSASATLSKGLQDIAAESTDYSKKAFAAGTAMYEKLLGARSVESAIQIQTEFAKQAYESFVAQATKVSELYTRVASDALKPVTTAYANIQK
jgi:hypothetical protein